MGLYRKLEGFFLSCIQTLWFWFIWLHECKNILKKRKLFANIKLTDEQKKAIDKFYIENYGRKIPYWWHRLYQSYTGSFDSQYVPEYIFSLKLDNDRQTVLPLENKNLLSVLFDDVCKTPKTYIMRINGQYFDGNSSPITKDIAVNIVEEMSFVSLDAVLKATVDTSSGRDVKILQLVNGVDEKSQRKISEDFEDMGKNFVLQERVKPHHIFAAIYPYAINTLRVITYLINNQICIAPIVMRIGCGGNQVDNAHAGGMFIGVNDDGTLKKEAYTEYQKRYLSYPDTGIVFEGYQLPYISEIKDTAKKLHQQIPMVRFISWDIAVNDENEIILIEANLHSQAVWLSQMAHGKAFFGEHTAEMLKLTRK